MAEFQGMQLSANKILDVFFCTFTGVMTVVWGQQSFGNIVTRWLGGHTVIPFTLVDRISAKKKEWKNPDKLAALEKKEKDFLYTKQPVLKCELQMIG